MSPEQLSPSDEGVDRRTDVFSLGATLFECLTLQRPFDASIRNHGSAWRLPDARRLNSAIGRDLAVVLETALEQERQRRYPTALLFAEELRRVRAGEPIHARPAGVLLRARRWFRSSRAPATALVAVLLALSVLLAGAVHFLRQARSSEARVRDEAEGERLLAEARATLDSNPSSALELALEGATRSPGLVASNLLLEAIDQACERRAQRVHPSPLHRCVCSPDGRLLATASNDGWLGVWDARSWRRVRALAGPGAALLDVAFRPDGRFLAAACDDGSWPVWDCSSWERVRVLRDASGTGAHLAGFDHAGRLVTEG